MARAENVHVASLEPGRAVTQRSGSAPTGAQTHNPTANIAEAAGASLEEARTLLAEVDTGVVMFRHISFRSASPLHRLQADSRRFLVSQLADYASDADRNDLELVAEAAQPGGGEVAAILSRQAGARLLHTA
jgi:hypothetical protein